VLHGHPHGGAEFTDRLKVAPLREKQAGAQEYDLV
jgi:hypothetical protein